MTTHRVPLRASGWLALVGVVLFATVGTVMITVGDTPQGPVPAALVAAGAGDSVPAGVQRVVWGTGAALVPAEVSCAVVLESGDRREVDTASGVEGSTAQVAGVGRAVVLGVTPRTQAGEVVCSGGGLERFATTGQRGGPPGAVVGVFFYVGAAVAAVWALATLTRRRPAA
ncbi:hypothetical protein [Xylanimonas ulmi]|uniref:Uncharacterized protein n=1 Tax=Xylanimonas ulmi TaxID=228973 RepID=A0A4Q7M367_9MICO|nr:hypothetical protein [Xylanibacterium ulmi]RZS60369.1 hypothetical protein EV386_0624 [Xylanibacterium ulmi]